MEGGQHRAASDRVLWQGPQPADQRRVPPVAPGLGQRGLDELAGTVEVAGGQGVPDRLVGEAVGLVPGAGAPVQQRHLGRPFGEQPRAQHVGEQVVVAEPGQLVVQRHDEQVGPLEPGKGLAPTVAGRSPRRTARR